MRKIAVIRANLGSFDKPIPFCLQNMDHALYEFNDMNFPPRHCSMTPRLQARIPKMFAWQMAPGYDYYLWLDSSYSLQHPDSVKWFYEQLLDADIALFQHPKRNSIREEADHIKARLEAKCPYITPRYENELIDEQLQEIYRDKKYVDDKLYASMAIIYRNTKEVQDMMKEWWYHTSRFHSVDQLALPFVIWKAGIKVNVLPCEKTRYETVMTPYMTKTRR